MQDAEGLRRAGRPRQHPSSRERAAAYLRRAAGDGLVRVSVLVPAGKAADMRAIAAAMRRASRSRRDGIALPKVDPAYPNARRAWSAGDDDALARIWRAGATGPELTSGFGRPLDEILRRLVDLEEVGSVREARAEAGARARSDRLPRPAGARK